MTIEPSAVPDHAQADQDMARYGISRVAVDYFHYRDYRYTNLKDAIAQARQNETAGR